MMTPLYGRLLLGLIIAITISSFAYLIHFFLLKEDLMIGFRVSPNGEFEYFHKDNSKWNDWLLVGLASSVMLWALLLGLITFAATVWSVTLPGFRRRFSHIPGYKGWPLIGNLLDIQTNTWHGLHAKGLEKFGPVYRLWYGAEPHIVVASAAASKQVQVHEIIACKKDITKILVHFVLPSGAQQVLYR